MFIPGILHNTFHVDGGEEEISVQWRVNAQLNENYLHNGHYAVGWANDDKKRKVNASEMGNGITKKYRVVL